MHGSHPCRSLPVHKKKGQMIADRLQHLIENKELTQSLSGKKQLPPSITFRPYRPSFL